MNAVATAVSPTLHVIESGKHRGVDTFEDLPIVVARGARALSFGKGSSRDSRIGSALGECIERSVLYEAAPDIHATARELGDECLSPHLFGLDLPGEMPEFVLPHDADTRVGWIRVSNEGGNERWLHQASWSGPGFHRPTSNGAAVATSRDDAARSATAELLERHAFSEWWYEFGDSRPLHVVDSSWSDLVTWFEMHSWELTAHLLPSTKSLPVVLAAAVQRNLNGAATAAIIGLGTAYDTARPTAVAACQAAHEVLQAQEVFAVWESAGHAPTGDLTAFLNPDGAQAIVDRLTRTSGPMATCETLSVACPLAAATEANFALWFADKRHPVLDSAGLQFVQVFSPDTLPFASTDRGRRLEHPVLTRRLADSRRSRDTIPLLPHPLG